MSNLGPEVYHILFWMRNFNSPTMKRTMVLSNNSAFCTLDKGPVSKRKRRTARSTTKRYTAGDGKVRFVGTAQLKKSQSLCLD